MRRETNNFLTKREFNNHPGKRKPLDLHLVLGTDNSGDELANININVELKSEKISAICQQCELKEPLGGDVIFKLDFVIQEGREKQCLQYFQNGLDRQQQGSYDHDLSPLQNWLKRPKKSGKLQLYESNRKDGKAGVTLQYRFYQQTVQAEEQFVEKIMGFQASSFHPDININVKMLGKVQAWKKNRIKLKTDQMDINISSEEFKMKDLVNLVQLLKMLDEEQGAEILNHPIMTFLKGAEQLQATLKMSPMSKMLELYQIGRYSNRQMDRPAEYPEVIKGLFKQQLRVTFIYSKYLAAIADCTYQSEAVLMRLLTAGKKYTKYFD